MKFKVFFHRFLDLDFMVFYIVVEARMRFLLFLPLWPLPGSFFCLFPLLLPLVAPLGSIFGPKDAKMSRSSLPQSDAELRISKELLGLPRFSRCKPKKLSDVQNVSSKCPR